MEFVAELVEISILTVGVLLWARWSRLDLGLRAPVLKAAWLWIALFILWCAVEQAVQTVYPVEVDPEWRQRVEAQSLPEALVMDVVLGPLLDELLFRGALFSALIRRWGIGVAAVIPSLLWGILHTQYEWWLIASIAGSGVVLAIARWKSGSLYVPLALHMAFNLAVTLPAYAPSA